MKYCLRCGRIYSEFWDDYENNKCIHCGFQLIEDNDMTEEQYLKLSELEKDEYELKIYNICKQSEVFDEDDYKEMHDDLSDWYLTFRFDKYEQLTGEKAFTKQNKLYHKMEAHKRVQEAMDKYAGTIEGDIKTVNEHIPRCPICQSTRLSKISTGRKILEAGFGGIWGMDVMGKTYECRNCGSKF